MRNPIIIHHPRELSLVSTVGAAVAVDDLGQARTIAAKLTRDMRHAGSSPAGPVIQNVHVTAGGTTHMLMRQTRETPGTITGYVSHPPRTVTDCVLARFDGAATDLGIVYSALAVYAYEHEIDLTGDFHLVFVNQDELNLTVDVFASTTIRD